MSTGVPDQLRFKVTRVSITASRAIKRENAYELRLYDGDTSIFEVTYYKHCAVAIEAGHRRVEQIRTERGPTLTYAQLVDGLVEILRDVRSWSW